MGVLGLRLGQIWVTPGRDMSILPAKSSTIGQSRMWGSDLARGGSFPTLWPQTHAIRMPCFPDRWGTQPPSPLREREQLWPWRSAGPRGGVLLPVSLPAPSCSNPVPPSLLQYASRHC